MCNSCFIRALLVDLMKIYVTESNFGHEFMGRYLMVKLMV
jgi:hypothetical protein